MTQEHDHERHDNEHEHGQELLTRNKAYLLYLVHDFMQRGRGYQSGVIDADDLLQEVTLCFLSEVKRYGEEEARRHKRTLFNSMYTAAIRAYPLSMPQNTSRFKKLRDRMGATFQPWEQLSEYSIREEESLTDEVMTEREILSSIEKDGGLDEEERYIIELKYQGMNQREIARILNTYDVAITRKIQAIRKKLKDKNVLQ